MALDTYPIGIDEARLQRVADVMYQFGLLPNRFNVVEHAAAGVGLQLRPVLLVLTANRPRKVREV